MLSRFVTGLLLVCALFAPLSVSFQTSTNAVPIAVHVQKADAIGPLLIPGIITLAGALGIGSWVSDTIADYVNSFFAFIGSLFVKLAVTILGLTGAIFDYAIWAFASNLTLTLEAMGIVDAIKRIWVVFRDLSQIVLVGFFIFIAINIILNNHEYSIKQHAVRAILVGLFMNFSLFFSMAVIDVSNFIAYQFYRGVSGVGGATTPSNIIGTQANISERIVTSLGITQLNNWSSWAGQDLKRGGILETIVASVGVTLILLVTSLVLLYAVWLLLRRAVLLILIMLTSSLAATALIIPKFHSYFDQWRSALLGNAFFAPLFLLMLWTVIQIMDAIAGANLPGLRPETFVQPNAIQGAGSALARYGIVIGLLIAAVKISDTLAKKGSELFGVNVGSMVGGVAGGITGGAFGFAAERLRNGRIKRGDSRLSELEKQQSEAKERGDYKAYTKAGEKLEKLKSRLNTSGDFRDAAVMKALQKIGLQTGKAKTEKLDQAIKDRRKKEDDKAKDMVPFFKKAEETRKAAAVDTSHQEAVGKYNAQTSEITSAINNLGQKIDAKKNETSAVEKVRDEAKQAVDQINRKAATGAALSEEEQQIRTQKTSEMNEANQKISDLKAEIDKATAERTQKEAEKTSLDVEHANTVSKYEAVLKKREEEKVAVATKLRESAETTSLYGNFVKSQGVELSDRAVAVGSRRYGMSDAEVKEADKEAKEEARWASLTDAQKAAEVKKKTEAAPAAAAKADDHAAH